MEGNNSDTTPTVFVLCSVVSNNLFIAEKFPGKQAKRYAILSKTIGRAVMLIPLVFLLTLKEKMQITHQQQSRKTMLDSAKKHKHKNGDLTDSCDKTFMNVMGWFKALRKKINAHDSQHEKFTVETRWWLSHLSLLCFFLHFAGPLCCTFLDPILLRLIFPHGM